MWAIVFVAIAASEITAGALETRLGATIFNWVVPVGLVLFGVRQASHPLERPVRRRVDEPRRDAEPGRALGSGASQRAAISNSSSSLTVRYPHRMPSNPSGADRARGGAGPRARGPLARAGGRRSDPGPVPRARIRGRGHRAVVAGRRRPRAGEAHRHRRGRRARRAQPAHPRGRRRRPPFAAARGHRARARRRCGPPNARWASASTGCSSTRAIRRRCSPRSATSTTRSPTGCERGCAARCARDRRASDRRASDRRRADEPTAAKGMDPSSRRLHEAAQEERLRRVRRGDRRSAHPVAAPDRAEGRGRRRHHPGRQGVSPAGRSRPGWP